MRVEGGLRGLSQWVQLEPNKLWRSNSIFNLWGGGTSTVAPPYYQPTVTPIGFVFKCLMTTSPIILLLGYIQGLIKYKDTKTKCRLYGWLIEFIDWRMEIQSVLLVFSTQLCEPLLLKPSLWFTSPLPKVKVQKIQKVCGWEWVEGVELCWRPYSSEV
jgi:hypothetical protein